MDKPKKLICVIPVYNEEDLIENTVLSLRKIKEIDEIVIVNDGSTDNTREVLESIPVKFINLEKNMGKGYSMNRAIKSLEYDYIAFIDGDLGRTSEEVRKLITPVLNDEADVTIANFTSKTNIKGGFGIVKKLAKKGVYFFTKVYTDTALSGQRVFKKEVIDKIEYIPDRYGVEVAMTIQTYNNDFNVLEVPVTMSHRYTERNIKGFLHRGRQFYDILKTFIIMYFRR